jgi:hypothetical protein
MDTNYVGLPRKNRSSSLDTKNIIMESKWMVSYCSGINASKKWGITRMLVCISFTRNKVVKNWRKKKVSLAVNLRLWKNGSKLDMYFTYSFIQSVVSLTTGPQPHPKRVLHRVRYNASFFNFQYLITSSSSYFRPFYPSFYLFVNNMFSNAITLPSF